MNASARTSFQSFAALGLRCRVRPLTSSDRKSRELFKHIQGAARALCAAVPVLADCFRLHSQLPSGWFLELPASVAAGRALPEQARQIFWLLSGISQQCYVLSRQPELLQGTLFGHLFIGMDDRCWRLIRPDDGLASLADLVLTFEHEPLAKSVSYLFHLLHQAPNVSPKGFLNIEQTLAWQELVANAAHRRRYEGDLRSGRRSRTGCDDLAVG